MFGKWRVDETAGLAELRNVRLEGLDLSWSDIERPALFSSVIRDCRFDQARLRAMKMWAVDVDDSSFEGADLRDTLLGGTLRGRWNTFRRVRFVDANLRATITPDATFDGCAFDRARLKKVEFQSDFIDCHFAGRLEEVTFYSKSWMAPGARTGTRRFENVDFTDAEFHWVDFRGFDLDTVRFPVAPGHIVVEPLRCSLERALVALKTADLYPGLVGMLNRMVENAGPNQLRGIVDVRSLREAAGHPEEPVEQILQAAIRACIGIVS